MNELSDSFSVLVSQWQLITGIVLMMLLSQMLIGSALRIIFRDRLPAEEYFALSAVGWMLPLSLASVLWLILGAFLPDQVSALLLILLVAILAIVLFPRAHKEHTFGSRANLLSLIILFGVFLFLRLAFVSKTIVPLYFDSAQHYMITDNLLKSLASNQFPIWGSPSGSYYHIGFHFLTAFVVSALRADIIDAILILGQIIVAAASLSMFAIVKHETQSNVAAIFTVLLAAFGWYMPAYAANWGKYPALTSLPLIVFVISLAYLNLQYRSALDLKKYFGLILILLLGTFITVLFHSRTIVVLGIIALAWAIVSAWQRLASVVRVVTFLIVIAGIVLVIMHLRTKDVFGLLFDPYWDKGLWVTVGVLFLTIFALWRYPRLAFASILVILLLLGCLLVPVNVPGYGILTLLDRPFVEMILYLPLSFLGGAGLAGLEKSVMQLTARWSEKRYWSAQYVSGVFIVLLLINAFAEYNIYPAECCDIVGRDDLVAIDWLDKNTPSDSIILISSTELRVLDTNSPHGAAGGDAGVWITPLAGRVTTPLPYQTDFNQQEVFDTVCRRGVDYIYVGEIGAVFNNGLISTQPDRYKIMLSMPKTKIYQVSGCPQTQ